MTKAETLFKEIKKRLTDARRYNKENKNSFMPMSQSLTFETWERTSGGVKTYILKAVETDTEVSFNCKWDIEDVCKELAKMLDAQKKVKGWGGLTYTWKEQYISWDMSYKFIDKVCLADPICKEYKSLQNYINKYGQGNYGSINLGDYRLYNVRKGGKRGVLWCEEGERMYLDNKPKKCAEVLAELRKFRSTNDTMKCTFGNEDYIDEIDRKYSIYHEIECDGEGRNYLLIEIKTPSGKVKYSKKIY